MTPDEYLSKIYAMANRPLLSNPADQETFYRRLIAQTTRKINQNRRGKIQEFSTLELKYIIDELYHKIQEIRNGSP